MARMSLVRRALPSWALTPRRVGLALRGAVLNLAIVGLTVHFLPGVEVAFPWALIRLVVLIALIAALLRPLLFALGVAVGGSTVIITGLVAQAGVMYAALYLDPGVHFAGFPAAFAASWITAGATAFGGWLTDAGSESAFFAQVLRQVVRYSPRNAHYDSPGLVIIQIDGLSAPLLRFSLSSGALPTISRWVRSGSHHILDWHTGLPSTTPGSQSGILHGAATRVPAFRWYEKKTSRLMVANRSEDAAEIETRLSDGKGLLADGGVSISNVFSGDAETSFLTFSRTYLPKEGASGYATFLSTPQGFSRAFVLTLGAMITNLLQVRRQSQLRITPRVRGSLSSISLRAVTTVLLRDIDVTLMAEQMAKGAPVIYADFVDYDEVAHHAGPTRPESLNTLQGIDGVLRIVERLATTVKRRYEIVVLSDHGQAQGATFRQRHGVTLEDVVRDLVGEGTMQVATGTAETYGPVNALLTEITQRGGRRGQRKRRTSPVTLGPGKHEGRLAAHRHDADHPSGPADEPPEVPESVVAASGNLALVYLPRIPGQATFEQIMAAHPRLVPGLAEHPGVGLLVVTSEEFGPIALGAGGTHRLRDGVIDGDDPVAAFGPLAAADLLEHQGHDHVGDLVLISTIDPVTHEVAAFEELVGSHGGLGGDQTNAFLLHPTTWRAPGAEVMRSDAVHDLLTGWRRDLQAPATRTVVEPVGSRRLGASEHSVAVQEHEDHDEAQEHQVDPQPSGRLLPLAYDHSVKLRHAASAGDSGAVEPS